MAQPEMIDAALRFAADDPDPATAADLRALAAAAKTTGDLSKLRSYMEPPLAFGTAGLRGLLGPGPARMNRAVVAKTTAALCQELVSSVPDAPTRGLCIAYDARHGSYDFAMHAAQVALGQGLSVHLFEEPVPTPLLAFAVLHLRAAAGIVITASHNPPAYNGYKVYLDNGAQLGAPQDESVAARITGIASARALPLVALHNAPTIAPTIATTIAATKDPTAGPTLHRLGETMRAAYLTSLDHMPRLCAEPSADVTIAYTPMHGVGYNLLAAALTRAGFNDLQAVPSQVAPDPDFPTVAFPNPEEPGAMDAVIALGESIKADLALANDPDADRLAVAARDAQGKLRMFTGNQVGALLADALLQGRPANAPQAVLCYSIVSSPIAEPIARHYGARAAMTLTGFKWVCNRGLALAAEGYDFVLGFEEALGYAANPAVRDKDGISAAQLIVQLAAREKAQGSTLWQRLHRIYLRHGCHSSGQLAITLSPKMGQAEVARVMGALRSAPPKALSGLSLCAMRDLLDEHTQQTLELPPADVVILELAQGHRICVRPSGTEPKLKFYFDVNVPMATDETLESALRRSEQLIAELQTAMRVALNLEH